MSVLVCKARIKKEKWSWWPNLPDFVEEVVVLVDDAFLDVFCCLGVVLENHSDVHVDNDKEAEYKVHDHEGDPGHVVAAVAGVAALGVRVLAVTTVVESDGCQCFRPTSRRAHLQNKNNSQNVFLLKVFTIKSMH